MTMNLHWDWPSAIITFVICVIWQSIKISRLIRAEIKARRARLPEIGFMTGQSADRQR